MAVCVQDAWTQTLLFPMPIRSQTPTSALRRVLSTSTQGTIVRILNLRKLWLQIQEDTCLCIRRVNKLILQQKRAFCVSASLKKCSWKTRCWNANRLLALIWIFSSWVGVSVWHYRQPAHPTHLVELQSQPRSQFGTTSGYARNIIPCSDDDFSNLAHLVHPVQIAHPVTRSKH